MSRLETGIIQIKKKDQDIAKTVQSAAAAVSCRTAMWKFVLSREKDRIFGSVFQTSRGMLTVL